MTAATQKHYWRADITGLRALAVLPVVIYHAFPELIPGGFVGVDIFFVISGYLISGILFRNLLTTGRIDFWDFYQKRILRILPNLTLLLLSVLVAGYLVFTGEELKKLGQHVYSSAGFYQNFRLLGEVGYFDTASMKKPLLHLWSLAIEEQFYLIFPVICALIWRFTRSVRCLGIFVLALLTASFVWCVLESDKTFDFYFPLTRFWELGVGILLAYLETFALMRPQAFPNGVMNAASGLGLLMIVGAMFGFSHDTVFPGPMTILPVVGATLLIFGGSGEGKVIVNQALTWSPIVFVGLVSYSLYLWHWPIMAVGRMTYPQLSTAAMCGLIAVSLVASVLVYHFVENPMRRIKEKRCRNRLSVLLLILLVLCIVLGQVVRKREGFPERAFSLVPSATLKALNHHEDWGWRDGLISIPEIHGYLAQSDTAKSNPQALTYLFVGDSHMEQYIPRVKQLIANRDDVKGLVLTEGGCLAVPSYKEKDAGLACSRIAKGYEIQLNNGTVSTFVISQIWGGYLKTKNSAEGNRHTVNFDAALRHFADLPKRYPNVRFVVILDVPWDDGSYDLCNGINRFGPPVKEEDLLRPFPKQTDWLEGNELVRRVLGEAGYEVIDPVDEFCPNQRCSLLNYKDDDHLRSSYVREHAVWIDRIFE